MPVHERVKVEDLGQGFYRVLAYNGYMQRPNVPEIMKAAIHLGLPIDEAETIYYLGRVSLFSTGDARMMRWRKVLFAFMSRNAAPRRPIMVYPPIAWWNLVLRSSFSFESESKQPFLGLGYLRKFSV